MLELTGGPQERDASDHKDGRVLGRDASGNKLFGGSCNGSSLLSESGSSSLDGDGGPCFDWVSKQITGRGSEGGRGGRALECCCRFSMLQNVGNCVSHPRGLMATQVNDAEEAREIERKREREKDREREREREKERER